MNQYLAARNLENNETFMSITQKMLETFINSTLIICQQITTMNIAHKGAFNISELEVTTPPRKKVTQLITSVSHVKHSNSQKLTFCLHLSLKMCNNKFNLLLLPIIVI